MAKVIAISNQKGGVGKTTTTFNLGAGLALYNNKVLLIDLDSQGSLSIYSGISSPDKEGDAITQVLLNEINGTPYDIQSYGVHHISKNLDIVPGNASLSSLSQALSDASSHYMHLKAYIDKISPYYDYILIDCMPALSILTINALSAADSVLIPLQPHYLAVRGLLQLVTTIDSIRRSYNPSLTIEGIVFTMTDERTNMVKDIERSVIEQYGSYIHIFSIHIPFSIRASESTIEGISIFTYAPKSKVATAYKDFVLELLNYDNDTVLEVQ